MTEESDLLQLANEAMRLEYNVSKLYMIFRDSLPEDTEFWWKLVIEESNHAALIKSGLDYFMQKELFRMKYSLQWTTYRKPIKN